MAAHRLIQSDEDVVRLVFSEIHSRWFDLILSDIADPAVARAVMLLGDGLYFNATIFGFQTGAPAPRIRKSRLTSLRSWRSSPK
ncbi:hypothetical protein NHF46_18865 [Arthrobacter alpinus]|nr:hypothetical protein [Arthrobacter alpinus]